MMQRTGNGLRGTIGAAVTALACGMAASAFAQDPVFTFPDLLTFDGEDSGWYGYRTNERYLLLNATNPTGTRYFSFTGPAGARQFTIAAGFLEGDADTSIGLFCCQQEDGQSPYLAFVMMPGNHFEVIKIDPVEAMSSTVLSIDDVAAEPYFATLSMIETPDGIELVVDGENVGSYGDGSISPGKSGIFVWGIGVYAIYDFLIYDQIPAATGTSGDSGRPSLFGKGMEQDSSNGVTQDAAQ